MKKNLNAWAAATLLAGMVLTGCGGAKQAQTSMAIGEHKVKVEKDECQLLAEEKPATRAWGEATYFKLSQAAMLAEAQARAKMAAGVRSAVDAASRQAGVGFEQHASNDSTGMAARDQGMKQNLDVDAFAKEVVAGTMVIKTTQYLLPNKQYQVFVCLEYNEGVLNMADKLTKKLTQQVSDRDRQKMEEQIDKFRELFEKEMEKPK